MRKITFILTALILSVCLMAGTLYAMGGRGENCHKGLEDKLFCKAKFMFMNQDEIGLTQQQVDKIKDIKIEAKKELIKKNAEIDILKVDIKAKMYEDKTDVMEIDKLIDQKYDMKKEKAKYIVKKYAEIKEVLTPEQYEKAKKIWIRSKKK